VNKTTGILMAFLIVLSLGLATDTVMQHLGNAQAKRAAARHEGAVEAKSPPKPAPPASRDVCVPTFETLTVKKDVPRAKFAGEWINTDASRHGLTRVTCVVRPDGLYVKPWALQCAGEKPYGEARKAPGTGNPWEMTWDAGFAETVLRFALTDDGRLRVDGAALVRDPSGTQTPVVVHFLKKATPAELKVHAKQQQKAAAEMAKAEAVAKRPAQSGGT
jgi:hypothetical protein